VFLGSCWLEGKGGCTYGSGRTREKKKKRWNSRTTLKDYNYRENQVLRWRRHGLKRHLEKKKEERKQKRRIKEKQPERGRGKEHLPSRVL